MADNGDKGKQKDLMYWIKAASAMLGLLLVILEFFGITSFRDILKRDAPPYNTVIVLDGSSAMTTGVLPDGTTKFEAAKSALEKTKLGNEHVALRLFGGACENENSTWLEVDFDKFKDNKKEIVAAFQERFDTREDRAGQIEEDQPTLNSGHH